MPIPAMDPPGLSRGARPADAPADRDERRIRAMVDAIRRSSQAGSEVEQGARRAALRTLLGYGEIGPDRDGVAALR